MEKEKNQYLKKKHRVKINIHVNSTKCMMIWVVRSQYHQNAISLHSHYPQFRYWCFSPFLSFSFWAAAKSQSQSPKSFLKGFGPRGWDMGLEAEIWASRLGGGGCGGGENSPYVWEQKSLTPSGPLPCSPLNFNHNLLRQGTGTADHLTLLRLSLFWRF